MPKSSRVTKMILCRYVMRSEITIAYLCVPIIRYIAQQGNKHLAI